MWARAKKWTLLAVSNSFSVGDCSAVSGTDGRKNEYLRATLQKTLYSGLKFNDSHFEHVPPKYLISVNWVVGTVSIVTFTHQHIDVNVVLS